MIEITFTGETLEDLAAQAANFAGTVGGAAPVTEQPKRGRRAEKVKPEAAPAEVDPPRMEQLVPEDTNSFVPVEPDLKALEATKEKALDILRNVYNSGAEGQKAVRAILKDFGVKKAGDVPADQAEDLLTKARAALVEIKAE